MTIFYKGERVRYVPRIGSDAERKSGARGTISNVVPGWRPYLIEWDDGFVARYAQDNLVHDREEKTMLTLAQYSYQRFWLLAQSAYIAESQRYSSDRAMGYCYAMQTALQDSIAFSMDTCVTLITQRRDGIAPDVTGVPDPYRDGYVEACNRALDIIAGRL